MLMVGGNIPGVTRTVSIAIYDEVQSLDYALSQQNGIAAPAVLFCGAFRGLWSQPKILGGMAVAAVSAR